MKQNAYKTALISHLANYPWHHSYFNAFTIYFDYTYTIISDNADSVKAFNTLIKDFQKKWGMSVRQAEIHVYLRAHGATKKLMIRTMPHTHQSYGTYHLPQNRKQEIRYTDLVDDLNAIKVWCQQAITAACEDLGLVFE